MGRSITIPSAAITIYIDDKIIGFATSISYERDLGIKVIYGVDDPLPQEIAITGPYSIRGSIAGVCIMGPGDQNSLITHANTIGEYFNQKYATLEVKNRFNVTTQFKITNCIFHRDTWQADSRSTTKFSANFTGMFLQPLVSNG